MHTTGRDVTAHRLKDLERTVSMLNGQLRDVQQELQHTKSRSITERLWNQVIGRRDRRVFMSAVCGRRVRPNRKVVAYDRAGH